MTNNRFGEEGWEPGDRARRVPVAVLAILAVAASAVVATVVLLRSDPPDAAPETVAVPSPGGGPARTATPRGDDAAELAALPELDERTDAILYVPVSGDPGLLHILDVDARRQETRVLDELAPGDAPHVIELLDGRPVFFGHDATYAIDADGSIRSLGRSDYFLPSSRGDRVWLVETNNELGRYRIREVDVRDGRIRSEAVLAPPGWIGAVAPNGVVVQRQGALTVFDPATGSVPLELPDATFPMGTRGDRLAWCGQACRAVHVLDVRSGRRVTIDLPDAAEGFEPYSGSISPDGRHLAAVLRSRDRAGGPRYALAVTDLEQQETSVVADGHVRWRWPAPPAWDPTGSWLFFPTRDAVDGSVGLGAYRPGDRTAHRVPALSRDVYGLAVGSQPGRVAEERPG